MNRSVQITILSLSVVLALVLGFGLGWTTAPGEPSAEPGFLTIDGQKIPIFPGSEVDIEIEEEDDSNTAIVLKDQRGKSEGADLSTTVDSWTSNFQMTAPELELNGSRGIGGTAAYAAKGLAAKGHMVLIFFGALCIIAGAVCMVYWDKKTGIYVAVAGLVLILAGVMFERYPWMALVIPLVGLGVVVYFWWKSRQGQRVKTALATVVAGVEKAPVEHATPVKSAITETAGGEHSKTFKVVKSEVSKVKANNVAGG